MNRKGIMSEEYATLYCLWFWISVGWDEHQYDNAAGEETECSDGYLHQGLLQVGVTVLRMSSTEIDIAVLWSGSS